MDIPKYVDDAEMKALKELASPEFKVKLDSAMKQSNKSAELRITESYQQFKQSLLKGADNVHIPAVFVEDSKGNEIFVVSTDESKILYLMNHPEDKELIDRIKKESETRGVNEVRMDYFAFDISKVTSENVFSYNMLAIRQVHLMSIARNCFHEFGYELPQWMSRYTIESLWELDQMRVSPRVNDATKEAFNETYTKAVRNAYTFYQPEDKNIIQKVVEKLCGPKQRVDLDWFKKNHIMTCYSVITEDAWNYMYPIIKEKYPEFRFYMDRKPFETLKAIDYDGPELTNFWKEDVEIKKYNIAFPVSSQDIYYSLLNEYNTKNYESKISLHSLQIQTEEARMILVPMQEMDNWESLCKANNVPWALDNGQYSEITSESANVLPIMYRSEDEGMVRAIQNRLSNELDVYQPSTRKSIDGARAYNRYERKETSTVQQGKDI